MSSFNKSDVIKVSLPKSSANIRTEEAIERMVTADKSAIIVESDKEYLVYSAEAVLDALPASGVRRGSHRRNAKLKDLNPAFRISISDDHSQTAHPSVAALEQSIRASLKRYAAIPSAQRKAIEIAKVTTSEILIIGALADLERFRLSPTICVCECGEQHSKLKSELGDTSRCPNGAKYKCS